LEFIEPLRGTGVDKNKRNHFFLLLIFGGGIEGIDAAASFYGFLNR
jgi:hypothetical protein